MLLVPQVFIIIDLENSCYIFIEYRLIDIVKNQRNMVLYLLKLLILYLSQQCCMIKSHKDPLKRIQLSLFVFVLGAILYCSIIMLSMVGISPIQLSTATTTTNTTSDEVTFLNSKGMSLNSLGKFNESITYFDKVLSVDPKNIIALTQKANAFGGLGKYPEAITYYDKVLDIRSKER